MFYKVIFVIVFAVSTYFLVTATQIDKQLVDVNSELEKLPHGEFITEINKALKNCQSDDAENLISLGEAIGLTFSHDIYSKVKRSNSFGYQASCAAQSTWQGFITGKGENNVAISAAFISDMMVIGDARDLTQQAIHYSYNEPVDELVAALSGIGVGLTVLNLATVGSVTPAKVGISTLKVMKKSNQLSKPLTNELTVLAQKTFDFDSFSKQTKSINFTDTAALKKAVKNSFNEKEYNKAEQVFEDINSVKKNTGSIGHTVLAIKYTDNIEDIKTLSKLSEKFRHKTKAVLSLLGKSALRTVKVIKKTWVFFLELMGALISTVGLFFKQVLWLLKKIL